MGAHVVVASRNLARCTEVANELIAAGGSAEALAIDLGSFSSVRTAAAEFASRHDRLDVLVNNAGILGGTHRAVTADGHEATWQTNYLGLHLLTQRLVPQLLAAPAPRVVNVSSIAHLFGLIHWDDPDFAHLVYSKWRAYGQSKLAVVLETREFARRYPRIAAFAVHPGGIATNIWRGQNPLERFVLDTFLPGPASGASPIVRLVTSADVAGDGGAYFDRHRRARPSRLARSDADAARLWELAEATLHARL